jgi:hypothetical protein
VEFEFQGAKHRHRIERIEAFKLPGAGGPATPPMQAQVQG